MSYESDFQQYQKRHPEAKLPHEGEKGVCVWCGKPLPPKKRRWCGACAMDYLRARGFLYRDDAIDANKKKNKGNLKCESCGCDIKEEYGHIDCTVDHKLPLALGGTHELDNLWVLCPKCNKIKTAKDIALMNELRAQKRNPEKEKPDMNRKLDDFGKPKKSNTRKCIRGCKRGQKHGRTKRRH